MRASVPVPTIQSQPRSRGLHLTLWAIQIGVGLLFTFAGVMKSTQLLAELARQMTWVDQVPPWLARFIGVSELAGGLGLLLPSLTRIKPWLTPLAALGLAVVMVLAAGFHLMHGEPQFLPMNVVLGGLAAFVAYGRWRKAPIAPRVGDRP